jgi:cytochrome c
MKAIGVSGLFNRRRSAAFIVLAAALLTPGSSLAEEKLSSLERHGRALAEQMCSKCHAVGRSGSSPHGAAPPFRALENRVDLDTFTTRLREGLISGHPDMPMFRFTRDDARALTAYLRLIQRP